MRRRAYYALAAVIGRGRRKRLPHAGNQGCSKCGAGAFACVAAALLFAAALSLHAKKTAPPSPFTISLSSDQKIVHALSRLTFGPRPGDFDQARKMGLKKWIALQ